MATFSLGGGVTPGAPGVYINEQAGLAASSAIADFSTVYMLVETEDDVPVTKFPFNVPIAITSLEDYEELIRVGTQTVPESRIPLLSYNCVNEFYQNAQVGDLRVVRVGTPNQIVEIEFFPSGTKQNASDLPTNLEAGDVVYAQILLNGLKLVAGDGSTGYTSSGEWLGVPVEIPVNYIAGDAVNNRKISAAIVAAVTEAIESNPAVRGSVYVRDAGLVNDLDPSGNSQNGYVTIAATTYDANVSVVTQVLPVGANFAFMQNTYNVENIVGGSVQLERTPQDYTQCITTAFDGQQDQGYLITPTAYAQFDAEGRAYVGQIAAEHCASNSYKWMALADPGPFLITDVNKYGEFTPHTAAGNLVNGSEYLVDNAIYKWIGNDVNYNKLDYQTIVKGQNARTAVNESANLVADGIQVGLLDAAEYTISATVDADFGLFTLITNVWPVTLPIQKVTLTGAGFGNEFTNVSVSDGSGGTLSTAVDLNNQEVYVIAPPYDVANGGEYPENRVWLALSASEASSIYSEVTLAGGSSAQVTSAVIPAGAIFIATAPVGDVATVSYGEPYWDLPVDVNGQTSNLIENISGEEVGVNTLHLPATLQDATANYTLSFFARTMLDPTARITRTSGVSGVADNTALLFCNRHGLRDGQIIFWTNPVKTADNTTGAEAVLFGASTAEVVRAYIVKVIDVDNFVLASSLANYTNGNFVALPTSVTPLPHFSIAYGQVLAKGINDVEPRALTTLPMIRGRKYTFDSSSIFDRASSFGSAVSTNVFLTEVVLNNSSSVISEATISNFGEDLTSLTKCDYLPNLNTTFPTLTPVPSVDNAFCVPTVDQYFTPESYLVPSIQPAIAGLYDPGVTGTIGPAVTATITNANAFKANGTYNNVKLDGVGDGTGLEASITVAANIVTGMVITKQGLTWEVGDVVTATDFADSGPDPTFTIASIDDASGSLTFVTQIGVAADLKVGFTASQLAGVQNRVAGTLYTVVNNSGTAPNGDAVAVGEYIFNQYSEQSYFATVLPDTYTIASFDANIVLHGAQVEMPFSPEQGVPQDLWRFDSITSTEIIDNALRGVGFQGEPQAEFVEAGIDNVNRLYDDSQRYGNAFGFIAYYGPYIENGAGQYIPPSAYVTGVALRRYRSEGYQFPPAGVKYQLTDALGVQIPINSAQQNRLNPDGCNVVRTLPGYPTNAVYIWGGRTRLTNPADAQQKLYQFVNTRVILNVVYGSLRNAFDNQIFNVIDGFGVIYNQIISVGNSVLNQLYVRGALFGAKPSNAFQVICDNRINTSENLENGIINAKVFVTPVPTLERIQIDLIRVAIGKMNEELDIRGLGSNNA